MLFNSLHFFIFFPLVSIAYFLLKQKWRWLLLLLASCYFYMAFVPVYILILFFTIFIDYFAGIYIEKSVHHKKKLLILSIIANIGCLVLFKYYNFIIENLGSLFAFLKIDYSIPYLNIILPIGLSFHTFQALSYTIEVYRGKQKAEKHLGIYALYVMFYPQLVAGPIERPQNILHQFYEEHQFEINRVFSGLKIMLWGLFKKVFIADRLAILVDAVYDSPDGQNGLTYLIATFFFTIQIYCDFSGYSDMALGSAKVMGFDLMQNFKTPYLATSISDFWKRWHISLSTWFRDYFYIPLGGSKVSRIRTNINIFLVFMVSGFWHGANWTFMVWGALHGTYLLFENLINLRPPLIKVPKLVKIAFVFVLVMIAWVYFRAANIEEANHIIVLMASDSVAQISRFFSGTFDDSGFNGIAYSNIYMSLVIVFILFLLERKYGSFVLDQFSLATKSKFKRRFVYYLIIILLFFTKNEAQTFIYFQF